MFIIPPGCVFSSGNLSLIHFCFSPIVISVLIITIMKEYSNQHIKIKTDHTHDDGMLIPSKRNHSYSHIDKLH